MTGEEREVVLFNQIGFALIGRKAPFSLSLSLNQIVWANYFSQSDRMDKLFQPIR